MVDRIQNTSSRRAEVIDIISKAIGAEKLKVKTSNKKLRNKRRSNSLSSPTLKIADNDISL